MDERIWKPRVYLAGKITRSANWRGALVPYSPSGRTCAFLEIEEALDPNSVIALDEVDIIGPFFVSCDHGCAHGTRTHAVAGRCIDGGYDLAEQRRDPEACP